jgi:membrane fusion protein, multidrug efflux system
VVTRVAALLLAGAVAVALVLFLVLRGGGGEAAPPPPGANAAVPVPVTPVAQQTVPLYLDYIGATDAIRQVTLEAQVTGYLQKSAVADGADVKAGALLYRIDPSTYQAALDQAKAQALKDKASLDYAKANRQRNFVMHKTGDTSLDALQLATSTEEQDQAALAADQAAIETAEINLDHTQIRAPFAGRLSYAQVHEGALITTAGTPLNTLVQLDPIYATFNPPDTDLPEIEKYLAKGPIAAEVIVGEGTTRRYEGRLTFLDNSVGRGTGTITARATIDNPDHTLLPGQFVRVRLHIADQPKTLLVPQAAVGSSQLGKFLYVVGSGNKVEQHYVTLGAPYGTEVAVEKGVTAGELVVTGNLLRVGPGSVVKPTAQPQQAGKPGSSG